MLSQWVSESWFNSMQIKLLLSIQSEEANTRVVLGFGGINNMECLLLNLSDCLVSGNVLVNNLKGDRVYATSVFSCGYLSGTLVWIVLCPFINTKSA